MNTANKDWVLRPDDPRWAELVAADPNANIFHHPAWQALLSDSYGYRPFVLAAFTQGGQLAAGLPVMEVSNPLRGRRWVSLPFSDHCLPLACGPDGLERLNKHLRSLAGHAGQDGQPPIELRGYAPESLGQQTDEFATHVLDLRSDPDELLSNMHSMHRRNIKAARSAEVRVEQGTTAEHVEQFYRLHLLTRHKQGVPVQPRRFFKLLRENLLERGLGFVQLAYHEDRCVAAAVFLHWQKTLTYKYGASDPSALNLRPNNLLFWSAIEWGHEHDFEQMDMGRSSLANTGLRSFKTRWGAEENVLSYFTLSKQPVSHSNGRWMNLMNAIIHHSPPWVCRLSGEILYKYVG